MGATTKAATPRVLTLSDAAELLRVPVEGLQRDLDAGRLPGRVVAGEWRCRRAALLAWLDRPEPRALPPANPAIPPETEEEQEAFLAELRAIRKSWGPPADEGAP